MECVEGLCRWVFMAKVRLMSWICGIKSTQRSEIIS